MEMKIKPRIIGEIETSDEISIRSYFTTLLFGTIPIIGSVLLYIWSVSDKIRKNKQNLCKAYIMIKLLIIYPAIILIVKLISENK